MTNGVKQCSIDMLAKLIVFPSYYHFHYSLSILCYYRIVYFLKDTLKLHDVARSVKITLKKGREVTLPCSHRITCFYLTKGSLRSNEDDPRVLSDTEKLFLTLKTPQTRRIAF